MRILAVGILIFSTLCTASLADEELMDMCLAANDDTDITILFDQGEEIRVATFTDSEAIKTEIRTAYEQHLTENRSRLEPSIEFVPRYSGEFHIIVKNEAASDKACFQLWLLH